MTGPCVVVDPDDKRRAQITRVLADAGVSGLVETADVARLARVIDPALPLRLAVVAVCPPADGALALLSRLRLDHPHCLVLAIDGVDSETSAAWTLSAGAHDVLRLPFRSAEFEVRLARGLAGAPLSESAGIAEALVAGMTLTQAEERVLRVLAAHQGRIVTRNELSQHLYGTDWEYGDRRFDVHITRIRRKLRDVMGGLYTVRTVRSAGYVLEVQDAPRELN